MSRQNNAPFAFPLDTEYIRSPFAAFAWLTVFSSEEPKPDCCINKSFVGSVLRRQKKA